MGQFSWMFADMNNREALHEGDKCFLALPDGRFIYEQEYNGYGLFGGRDVYDIVADLNREFLSKNPEFLIPSHGGVWIDDKTFKKNEDMPVSKLKWYKAYADLSLSPDEVVEQSGVYEYRHIGIEIACYDDQNAKLPFPIKRR